MKVVLSGIYYPVAILRYFEAALKRRNDVELFTVGPYTGSAIPWMGGMNLPAKHAQSPNMALAPGARVPVKMIEGRLPWTPDLWLQVDAGFHFEGKPTFGANFIVGTDPHCLCYDDIRGFADKFFCMQTPYMKAGDVYLPYAYDPVWHSPIDGAEKTFDAALVGMPYGTRVKLVSALRAKGFTVAFESGPCYDEAREIYSHAKIGLNWSSLQDLCARVFEVMAMGLCPVVNRVPDLATMGFEEGAHYLGFDTLEEGVAMTAAALSNGWEIIARQALEAVKPHTWDARVESILNVV